MPVYMLGGIYGAKLDSKFFIWVFPYQDLSFRLQLDYRFSILQIILTRVKYRQNGLLLLVSGTNGGRPHPL